MKTTRIELSKEVVEDDQSLRERIKAKQRTAASITLTGREQAGDAKPKNGIEDKKFHVEAPRLAVLLKESYSQESIAALISCL